MAGNDDIIAVCSFCLRPNSEVTTLVAGPGAFIGNECVALSTVIAGKPKSSRRRRPWQQESTLEDVLTNLPRIAAAGAQVEQNLVSGSVGPGPSAPPGRASETPSG